jgi:hypothetical protein
MYQLYIVLKGLRVCYTGTSTIDIPHTNTQTRMQYIHTYTPVLVLPNIFNILLDLRLADNKKLVLLRVTFSRITSAATFAAALIPKVFVIQRRKTSTKNDNT